MHNYHSNKISAVLKEFSVTQSGLDYQEAEHRLKKFGYNELPKEKPLGALTIFISQFANVLIYILLFTGVLSIFIKSYKEAGVIFGAVLINVIIGYIQESKANNAIAKLKELVEHKAVVIRDGREMTIEAKLLVPGDIITIKAGNRIPADGRLIEAVKLSVNESGLTGESIPSHKDIQPVPKGASLADRENMVFAGTMAVHGFGKAVITVTGSNTELGKISTLVSGTSEEKTPLQLRLEGFSRYLGIIFSVICVVIFLFGVLSGKPFFEMLETGVAIGVAAIPEGLSIAVTVILALGMQQILKKKALTRKLIATETLGSTTVICTDKTGTLTEGKMHVSHIVIGENEFEISAQGSRQEYEDAQAVSLALQAGMMCNNSFIENPQDELASWKITGSPTEAALLSAAVQSGLRKEDLLKIEPLIEELPFENETKFMATLHRRGQRDYVLYEKGAPEIVLEKSSEYIHHGKHVKLGASALKKLKKIHDDMTSQGLRVIAVAKRELGARDLGQTAEKGGLVWKNFDHSLLFIGFIALKDPLRPEAAETIKLAISAGLKPVIITGDHRLTARTIAKEVGLEAKAENILTGDDLDRLSDDELNKIVKKIEVYARVSPHHKLRIVKALQARGEVVAMTGDGINDSPALKAADIGISLGTATDIAKETSDIVLLDDNFKTIVGAIRQGRVIFKNIRKVVTYLISDSFSEMILIVGSLLFGAPLALLPAQILWINIINDGFSNFSLAFEKSDDSVMREKPIKKNEPLLTREMKQIIFGAGIIRDLLLLAFFIFLWQSDYDIEYLRTLMFVTLGVKSLMSLFSLRRFNQHIWQYNFFSNRFLIGSVAVSFLLLLASVYWPPLQAVLSTSALDMKAWLAAFVFGIISIAFIEVVKSFKIKRQA